MIEINENHIGGCSHLSFFLVNIVCCVDQILDLRSSSMRGLKYLLNKQYKVEPTKRGKGIIIHTIILIKVILIIIYYTGCRETVKIN